MVAAPLKQPPSSAALQPCRTAVGSRQRWHGRVLVHPPSGNIPNPSGAHDADQAGALEDNHGDHRHRDGEQRAGDQRAAAAAAAAAARATASSIRFRLRLSRHLATPACMHARQVSATSSAAIWPPGRAKTAITSFAQSTQLTQRMGQQPSFILRTFFNTQMEGTVQTHSAERASAARRASSRPSPSEAPAMLAPSAASAPNTAPAAACTQDTKVCPIVESLAADVDGCWPMWAIRATELRCPPQHECSRWDEHWISTWSSVNWPSDTTCSSRLRRKPTP